MNIPSFARFRSDLATDCMPIKSESFADVKRIIRGFCIHVHFASFVKRFTWQWRWYWFYENFGRFSARNSLWCTIPSWRFHEKKKIYIYTRARRSGRSFSKFGRKSFYACLKMAFTFLVIHNSTRMCHLSFRLIFIKSHVSLLVYSDVNPGTLCSCFHPATSSFFFLFLKPYSNEHLFCFRKKGEEKKNYTVWKLLPHFFFLLSIINPFI